MPDHPCKEAGRRLKAALVSYQLGRAGVDRTLKQVPDDPGEGWAELAQELLTRMALQLDKSSNPFPGGSLIVQ
jgi:hypothetical protein